MKYYLVMLNAKTMNVFNHLETEQEHALEQGKRADQKAFSLAMTFCVIAGGLIALVLYLLLTAFI